MGVCFNRAPYRGGVYWFFEIRLKKGSDMEADAIALMVKLFENDCFYKSKTLETNPRVNGRDPGETRTHDQWLKRPLLYQLSYRIAKII